MVYVDGKELEVVDAYPVDDLDSSAADHILYTLRHKKALLMVYMELTGKIPTYISRLWYHDVDKLFMYYTLGTIDKISKLHRAYAIHHYGKWQSLEDRKEAILDYESGRFTKADKPTNAYETVQNYIKDVYPELKGILSDWGIDSADRKVYEFDLYNANIDYIEHNLYIKTCACLHDMFKRAETEDVECIVKDFYAKLSKISM